MTTAPPDNLASLDDVVAVMQRTLTDDQGQKALQLVVRATALLRVQAPWVDNALAEGTLSKIAVGTVVAGMVKRVLLNPLGVVSITTGPYSKTLRTRTGVGNDGDLIVTDEDIQKLTPQQGPTLGQIRLQAGLAPTYRISIGGELVEDGLVDYPNGLSGVVGGE